MNAAGLAIRVDPVHLRDGLAKFASDPTSFQQANSD